MSRSDLSCETFSQAAKPSFSDRRPAGVPLPGRGTLYRRRVGEVHPARQASAGGTYEGVDAFGLWSSGRPNGPAGPPDFDPVRCRVTVTNGEGGFLAERGLTRHWLGPGVTMTEVREPGVWGVFARPPGLGPFGGVVAFGGSSGGLGSAAAWAPMLASHGLAVLAIAYFGVPGLPDRLAEIPVETVARAAAWLLARDDVGLDRVAVMGQSRGGELALLAGASLDVIGAVVGVVPSGVVWCGFGAAGPLDVPAWSVGGRPVPYLPAVDGLPSGVGASEPVATTPGFARLLRDETAVRAAEIPIERIQGPILLVSGEDDAMWPSTRLSEIVERRAAANGFAHPVVHLRYPDAGHVCAGVPGMPVATEVRHPSTAATTRSEGPAPATLPPGQTLGRACSPSSPMPWLVRQPDLLIRSREQGVHRGSPTFKRAAQRPVRTSVNRRILPSVAVRWQCGPGCRVQDPWLRAVTALRIVGPGQRLPAREDWSGRAPVSRMSARSPMRATGGFREFASMNPRWQRSRDTATPARTRREAFDRHVRRCETPDLRLRLSGRQDLKLTPLPPVEGGRFAPFTRVRIRSSERQPALCKRAWTGVNRSALVSALVSTLAIGVPGPARAVGRGPVHFLSWAPPRQGDSAVQPADRKIGGRCRGSFACVPPEVGALPLSGQVGRERLNAAWWLHGWLHGGRNCHGFLTRQRGKSGRGRTRSRSSPITSTAPHGDRRNGVKIGQYDRDSVRSPATGGGAKNDDGGVPQPLSALLPEW